MLICRNKSPKSADKEVSPVKYHLISIIPPKSHLAKVNKLSTAQSQLQKSLKYDFFTVETEK